MKQAYLILGTHRSGTSLISYILSQFDLGIDKNPKIRFHDNNKSVIGYCENNSIQKLNEEILNKGHSSWDNPESFSFDYISERDMDNFRKKLKNIITTEFKEKLSYKDPRLILTFPIHYEILKKLGFKINLIFPYRNAMSIIKSLQLRDGLEIERAKEITIFYLNKRREIFDEYYSYDKDLDILEVNYENILNDTDKEILKIMNFIKSDINFSDVIGDIRNFINPKLNNS